MKKTLKKIHPLSCGKILAVIYAGMSLLFMPFVALGLLIPALTGGHGQTSSAVATGVAGVVMMLILPIFYGIMGFIFGLLGAWLYNVVAGWIGGLQFEVE